MEISCLVWYCELTGRLDWTMMLLVNLEDWKELMSTSKPMIRYISEYDIHVLISSSALHVQVEAMPYYSNCNDCDGLNRAIHQQVPQP